LNRYTKIVMNA